MVQFFGPPWVNGIHDISCSGKSAVKLSLQSFKDSYYYTNAETNRIPELKSYLEGKRSDQSALAVKVWRNLTISQSL